MPIEFKELDYQQTPHGEISLRRRTEPMLEGKLLFEVKLGEEFLMSSLFTEAEEQLANLGLARLGDEPLDVVIGGLGLGYTAQAALDVPNVRSVHVIEVMEPVISWHHKHLIPLGQSLSADPRCRFHLGDFFEMAVAADQGFYPGEPDKRAHALLLDIDHSPSHWLNSQNESFYGKTGLASVSDKLHPGGLFGLWSIFMCAM